MQTLLRKRGGRFGRNECAYLVNSISSLIDDLIAAFPAEDIVKKQQDLCQIDAEELIKIDRNEMELLEYR
jgi:hypothetical protein